MAGLQSCFRNVFIKTSLRCTSKNGSFLQPTRRQHVLVFQLPISKNNRIFRKSTLLVNYNLQYKYRLASTNVPPPDANVPPVEVNVPPVDVNVPPVDVNISSDAPKIELNSVENVNSAIVIDESTLPPVPSLQEPAVLEFVSTGLKEPSFQSLGLGSWTPPGIIQQGYEFLHINCDLPWWAAIATMTLVFRTLLFPIAIKARKNAVNMANNMPEVQALQMKLSEARLSGDYYAAASQAQQLHEYIREKQIFGLKIMIPALCQIPVFLSMYLALNKMANAPVESMKTGGLFWFQDLTTYDPYYVLPLYLVASVLAVIELGAEGNSPHMAKSKFMKYGMRVVPFVIFPFVLHHPAALLWYWSVSNTISLSIVGLLKIPAVGNIFGIPKLIKHAPAAQSLMKRPFLEELRDGYNNFKITKELAERERLKTVAFEKAGQGPIPRTFKVNPKAVAKSQAKA